MLSCVCLSETPWTVVLQAPLFMEYSRQGLLEWVAVSYSRGSSRPRDPTQVSFTAGRFFTILAAKEALRPTVYFYFSVYSFY